MPGVVEPPQLRLPPRRPFPLGGKPLIALVSVFEGPTVPLFRPSVAFLGKLQGKGRSAEGVCTIYPGFNYSHSEPGYPIHIACIFAGSRVGFAIECREAVLAQQVIPVTS